MTYRRLIPVEFNHCDPAGIVFYPRYFEMTNSVVENFFREMLDHPFARIHREGQGGVPTVSIQAAFRRPSRLGDVLEFTLDVQKVGRSSVSIVIACHCEGEARLTADIVLVWIGPDGKARSWPSEIAAGLRKALAGAQPGPTPADPRRPGEDDVRA